MRNIESLDFSKKHFIQVEFDFGVLRAGRIILSFKRQGKDFTKYSNFEKYNVKFVDYVEALANLDKIEKYNKDSLKRIKYLKDLDPVSSSTYKFPNIYMIIERINNSENIEQNFYDYLILPYFRNYEEFILSNETVKIKLKEYNIKKEKRKIYFNRPYDFFEIIKSPILTKKQKTKMINDTYNSCKTIKYSSLMIENMIKKENYIKLDLEDQRFLLKKWYEINDFHKIKTLKRLGINYV